MARSSSLIGDYISASATAPISTSATAAIWYKPDHAVTTGITGVCGFTAASQVSDFVLVWDHTDSNYRQCWAVSCNNAFPKAKYATSLAADGSWYHLCGTYNTTNITAYLNGSQDNQTANGTQNTTGNYAYTLGSSVHYSSPKGAVFDFAMWNVVLTVNEIAALARGIRPFNIRPTALMIYWPLDGLQSPEPDLSRNAKNGTVSGPAFAPGPSATMFTPRWPRNYDPVAATVPLSQTHFRFRTDTGAVDATPTWGDAEDAA